METAAWLAPRVVEEFLSNVQGHAPASSQWNRRMRATWVPGCKSVLAEVAPGSWWRFERRTEWTPGNPTVYVHIDRASAPPAVTSNVEL